jgi:membrane-associated phospholipid phosphatase
VLAGWMLGLGWAIVCWLVLRALQQKRVIEPPGLPPHAEVATEAEE